MCVGAPRPAIAVHSQALSSLGSAARPHAVSDLNLGTSIGSKAPYTDLARRTILRPPPERDSVLRQVTALRVTEGLSLRGLRPG